MVLREAARSGVLVASTPDAVNYRQSSSATVDLQGLVHSVLLETAFANPIGTRNQPRGVLVGLHRGSRSCAA